MKNIIIFISILFTLIHCKTINKDDSKILYTIYKIESLSSFYIIYCTKNNENYKIISKKLDITKSKSENKKIIIGESYNFTLANFPDYSNNKNPLTGFNPMVECFMLDADTKVCKEEGIIGLYTTKNLKGLYYSE